MAPRNALLALVALVLLGGGAYWFIATRSADDQPSPIAPAPATAPAWFRDVTPESGLQFTYRNGEEANQCSILESLGGGVALIDYDGDGLLDVFVTGGGFYDGPDKTILKGRPCKLYRNLGNFKFQDVTGDAGLDIAWWYTHGVAVADYDRDGWPDLLVTGYGRIALFHNEPDGKGGRRFVDVTEQVGLRDDLWSTSAGWADLDGDGFPDLYICHYVDWSFANHPFCESLVPGVDRAICPPQRFKPQVHALYHNDQGKAFRNVAAEHGFRAVGRGLGVILADFDDDGRPDIYVANDTDANLYFVNSGGKLHERAAQAGVALDEAGRPNGSMGIDAGDYDGSGRASLFVTNFQGEPHDLYRNLGKNVFHHQSRAAGIAAIGQHFVGFGTGFIDIDNDGWEDLVIVNGHVYLHPIQGSTLDQLPVLMHNLAQQGRRFFKDSAAQGGPFFQTPARGRGLVVGDLDNDGWPDLVISHTNSPVALLRNEAAKVKPARWLGVRLVGKDHRDIVGSTVILEGDQRKLTRFTKGGGSYLSANDPRILFGLGDMEKVQRVTVKWSWGATQTWDNLEPNAYWELRESDAAPRRAAAPKK